jgi:ATP/maltotriose-dependent transcriptional regulator MalT
MGVVDDLLQARRDFERGEWSAALESWSAMTGDDLGPDDLRDAAMAAYLLGRPDEAVDCLQRCFQRCQDTGDAVRAVRAAFHLSMVLGTTGDQALAAGWTSRATRLLDDVDADSVARGYVAFLRMFAHLGAGEVPAAAAAAAEATESGLRHRDPDLLALGLCAQGRMAIYSGRVVEGLALLDEAMAGAAADGVSPVIVGNVYCTAIEGCQEIGDLRRVAEWTSALHRWCTDRPELVAFTGQCAVHRGQVMASRGAWTSALEELELAVDRYRRGGVRSAVGLAEYERAELLRLRGELDAAEAAYGRADEHGADPQPGLALLWLAQGRAPAAVAAVRRLLAEPAPPVRRAALLPAAVHVLLAAGADDEARRAADELEQAAEALGSATLLARAAYAAAAVLLARGDGTGALPYLRKARQLWSEVDSPYEVARVQLLTGRALRAAGDEESARRELDASLTAFVHLAAVAEVEEVEALLEPARLPAGLTAREAEVLRLVASGRSNARIAEELTLSEKTVARHLSNIFGKLEVGSRTAAAAYAFEHGLA